MGLLDGLGIFTASVWIAAFCACVAEEAREARQNRLNGHSRHIAAAEAIHFAVGFLFGICPWLRPWNQAAGVGYILVKELFVDPWLIMRCFWWELEPGDRPYRWGPAWNQALELREKGTYDTASHLLGQLAGIVVYGLLGGH